MVYVDACVLCAVCFLLPLHVPLLAESTETHPRRVVGSWVEQVPCPYDFFET